MPANWLFFSLLAVTFTTVAVIAVYLKWFRPGGLGDDLAADPDRLPESVRHAWWFRAVEGLFLTWALALTAATISLLLRTFWGSARPFLVGAVIFWVILIGLIKGGCRLSAREEITPDRHGASEGLTQ